MNHYTHWVGLLLKPSEDEVDGFKKAASDEVDGAAAAPVENGVAE